jgi:Pentapeptide repeats (8 copies)
VNKQADLRHSSSAHPHLLHCEQRILKQREAAGLPYDSQHGKLWQDIKADLDKNRTRASRFAATAEWAFGKKTARVLGVLALFAVVVALLFVSLDLYVAPKYASGRKDLALAVAQILAGAALLSGLYFTWRTLQVNREGQITERFTRAIDQLGATDDAGDQLFEIRIGGIYALERIARESREDYWPIMEILTAYVRQHTPWRSEEAQQVEENAAVEKKSEEESREESGATEVSDPHPDIQAIITVLRWRTGSFRFGEPESLDLHETNLSGVNLRGANLSGANLSGANLSEANLRGAELSRADLSRAVLALADLSELELQPAGFMLASLVEANLSEADLQHTNLSKAHLQRADLSKVHLRATVLEGAWLKGADFSEAYLDRASLAGARGLTQAQLDQTRSVSEDTRLPPGLKPPRTGA